MKPLRAKLITDYGKTYMAIIAEPKVGAEVRLFCDNAWIGIGKVKRYPNCKITGPIRVAYGETMADHLNRLGKRLTRKAERRMEKMAARKDSK